MVQREEGEEGSHKDTKTIGEKRKATLHNGAQGRREESSHKDTKTIGEKRKITCMMLQMGRKLRIENFSILNLPSSLYYRADLLPLFFNVFVPLCLCVMSSFSSSRLGVKFCVLIS